MARLTTAEAEIIRDAAKAKILEMGAKMSVAVVDERGDLITMVRVDGAPWRTPRICQAKAVASAAFGRSSKDIARNGADARDARPDGHGERSDDPRTGSAPGVQGR